MRSRVIVLGGGYAGVAAAKRLARDTSVAVTLVNPRTEFVERIRLHQLMAGSHPAVLPLRRLVPEAVALVGDRAVRIDAGRHAVHLAGGEVLDFDRVVYAVGSRSRSDAVAGAAEHAVTVGDLDGAREARDRLARLAPGAPLTVIGAGLTGLELATELATAPVSGLGRPGGGPGTSPAGGPRVRLVSDTALGADLSEPARRYLRRHLARCGVEVVERVAATRVGPREVELADGRLLPSELTVLTATLELPVLATDSGLGVDAEGALLVDRELRAIGCPEVVGAGDSARIVEGPLRRSCQAAIPLGTHAAETVLHSLAGTAPAPVRPKFTGRCISLGRRAALFQHSTPSDVPTRLTVRGRAGAVVKEQICASTIAWGLNPARPWVSYSWS